MTRAAVIVGLLWLFVGACGRAPEPSTPVDREPRPDAPPPGHHRADIWHFRNTHRSLNAVEKQLLDELEKRSDGPRQHPAFMCVAREFAAFQATHGALPDETLDRLIAGRCGAPSTRFWWRFVGIYSDGVFPDSPVDDDFVQELVQSLAGRVPATAFGVGAHVVGPTGVVTLILATPRATFETEGPDAEGRVLVRGSYADPQVSLRALINHGRSDVAPCRVREEVRLPRFEVTCTMAPGDRQAWITLLSFAPGQGFGTSTDVLAVRDPQPPYRRRTIGLPPGSSAAERLGAFVNRLRRDAGLAPLALAPEQSKLVQSHMPNIFEALDRGDGDWQDEMRDELLAGRKVEGIIRNATYDSAIAYDGTAADWIAARLEHPLTREFFFDPYSEVLALGTHEEDGTGFAAAALTYARLDEKAIEGLAEATYERLREKREELGHVTQRIEVPQEVANVAADLMQKESDPEAALAEALAIVNRSHPRRLVGLTFTSGAQWTAPAHLYEPVLLECAVIATFTRRPGASWGEVVLFVLFVQDREFNALRPGAEGVSPLLAPRWQLSNSGGRWRHQEGLLDLRRAAWSQRSLGSIFSVTHGAPAIQRIGP